MVDPDPTGSAPQENLYPVTLDVSGRHCLVVGGGAVAARKAAGLLQCGALVTLVAPTLSEETEALAPRLHAVERRPYAPGEAAHYRLVITATGVPQVDAAVFDDADAADVWVNSADDREHCSFILPAVHRDGPVTVAVSTSGRSPALASWLRTRLAGHAAGAGDLADLLGDARARLVATGVASDAVSWAQLLDGPLPELVAAGDLDNARAIVDAAVSQ